MPRRPPCIGPCICPSGGGPCCCPSGGGGAVSCCATAALITNPALHSTTAAARNILFFSKFFIAFTCSLSKHRAASLRCAAVTGTDAVFREMFWRFFDILSLKLSPNARVLTAFPTPVYPFSTTKQKGSPCSIACACTTRRNSRAACTAPPAADAPAAASAPSAAPAPPPPPASPPPARPPPSASAPAPRRCPRCTNRLIASSDGSSTSICSGIFLPLKRLNHLLPQRRRHIVRHKRLPPQPRDRHLPRLRQRMRRTHHAHQLIPIHHRRHHLRVLRPKAHHPNLHRVRQHLIRDPARQRPLHRHLDPRMLPPKRIQHRQQIEARVLVRRQVQPPPMQLTAAPPAPPPPPCADSASSAHTPAAPCPHPSGCPADRSSSTSPSSASSLAITWLTAGCVRCSRAAARLKLLSSATARNVSN